MADKRILLKITSVLMIAFPILIFFMFNVFTPYWWDDFPNACFTVSWSVPRERLIGSFQDIIQSTRNLYTNPELAGNGRVFINFLQFVFCAPRNKTIFDVCNTFVYTLFITLVCYHGVGSFKKISPPVFLFVNIAIWLLTPAWGQNFLWLTGSLNYLWGLTFVLLFLIPYRKRFVDATYTQNVTLSILLFVMGVIAGWSMQNVAAGVCVLMAGYFIRKFFRKEKVCLFEIVGMAGILTGFHFLLASSTMQLAGPKTALVNLFKAPADFIRYCWIPTGIISAMGIEIFWFRKNKADILPLGYFFMAVSSFFSLAMEYMVERAIFAPIVFLLIAGLNLLRYFHGMPKRYWAFVYAKEIVKSYILSKAREEFIYSERERGVSDVYVKTPIPIRNSHSGLSGGIDILSSPNDLEYKIHNVAKALFYDIHSATGVKTISETHLGESFTAFFKGQPKEWLSIKKLFPIVYQNWGRNMYDGKK